MSQDIRNKRRAAIGGLEALDERVVPATFGTTAGMFNPAMFSSFGSTPSVPSSFSLQSPSFGTSTFGTVTPSAGTTTISSPGLTSGSTGLSFGFGGLSTGLPTYNSSTGGTVTYGGATSLPSFNNTAIAGGQLFTAAAPVATSSPFAATTTTTTPTTTSVAPNPTTGLTTNVGTAGTASSTATSSTPTFNPASFTYSPGGYEPGVTQFTSLPGTIYGGFSNIFSK